MWDFLFCLVLLCVLVQPILVILAGDTVLSWYCPKFRVVIYIISALCILVTFPISLLTCGIALVCRTYFVRWK